MVDVRLGPASTDPFDIQGVRLRNDLYVYAVSSSSDCYLFKYVETPRISTFAPAYASILLKYPVFVMPVEQCKVYQENRSQSCMIWPNGPGVRYGSHQWMTKGGASTLRASPINKPPGSSNAAQGYKPSALDWLTHARTMFEGQASSDSLNTRISAMWDSFELASIYPGGAITSDEIRRGADTYTCSTMIAATGVGPIGLLVNGYGWVPMPLYPTPKRSTTTYAPNGSYAQVSYSFAQLPRFIVSPVEIELWNGAADEATSWTSVYELVPGWVITSHSHAVTNSEGVTYEPRYLDYALASVSPYQGYFTTGIAGSGSSLTGPALTRSPNGGIYKAEVSNSGNIVFKRTNYGLPAVGYDYTVTVTSSNDCSSPAVARTPDGTIHLMYVRENPANTFTGYEQLSHDDGETWNTATVAFSNSKQVRTSTEPNGGMLRTAFVYDSGSSGPGKIYYTYQSGGDVTPSAATPILDSVAAAISFSDTGFDTSFLMGAWQLSATKYAGVASTDFWSADNGATWTEF